MPNENISVDPRYLPYTREEVEEILGSVSQLQVTQEQFDDIFGDANT